MAKKGQVFKKYSPEFKLSVILDMREHHLGYVEVLWKISFEDLKLKYSTAKNLKALTLSYKNFTNIFITTTMKEYL